MLTNHAFEEEEINVPKDLFFSEIAILWSPDTTIISVFDQ